MLDRLIDFILNQISNIIPFIVVYEYQRGVLWRFGRPYKVLNPGIHFKIPYVDTRGIENYVDTTMVLPAQSITTKDGKEVVIKAAIGYKIINIEDFFVNVYDTKSALADRACVIIRQTIAEHTYKECTELDLDSIFLNETREVVKSYGLEVQFVSLIDFTNSRSFRLFNEASNNLM